MSEHFDQVHEEGCIETGVRHPQTWDAQHGRLKNRYYYQASFPESLKELTDFWKGAKSIGRVHNLTVRDGKECCKIPYYLSILPVSVKKFASAVRAHWGIENSFHWVLDMTFNEDQRRIRKGHSRVNFALRRRFAINILSLDTSKECTRKKRKRAAWDENYLLNCLAAII
jgi:predicted transposase YbfD/YdcC